MMGLSVMIASWDRLMNLEFQLETLYNQTVRPEKIIVIDAGFNRRSTTAQRAVVGKYSNTLYVNYFRCKRRRPKRRLLNNAYNKGLRYVESEFVAAFDADAAFEPDYIERCINLMSQYKNMGLSTPSASLPYIGIVREAMAAGKSMKDIVERAEDGSIKYINFGLDYGFGFGSFDDFPYLCSSDNPHPTKWTYGWDGEVMFRTQQARDANVFVPINRGYGTSRSLMANMALAYGISLVATRDITAYHTNHDKERTTPYRGTETTLVLQQRLYDSMSEQKAGLIASNPLIPILERG